jgi:hypothetical protein
VRAPRWTAAKKAGIICAVRKGYLVQQELPATLEISLEEYSAWVAAYDQYGVKGLKTTKTQTYRRKRSDDEP